MLAQYNYVWRLLAFAFRANPLLYASLALSFVSVCIEIAAIGALQPLALLSSGQSVSDLFVPRTIAALGIQVSLTSLTLCFLSLFLVRILTSLVSQGLAIYLGRRVLAQLGTGVFERLIRLTSLQEFQGKSVGHYVSLAGDEAARASSLVVAITQFGSSALLCGLYFLAIVALSPIVGAAVAAFLGICLFALLGAFRKSHELGNRSIEASRDAGSIFVDSISGVRDLRAFNAEEFAISQYGLRVATIARLLFRIDFINVLARLVPVLILLCFGFAMVLGYAGTSAPDVSFAVTLIVMLMRFFPVVGQSLNLLLRITADAKAGQDVTSFVQVVLPASRGHRGHARLDRVDRLEVLGLGFSYPGKPVLSNVNFTLARGKSYALRGLSGAGKSTIVDLLLAFQKPERGRILINGQDIATFDEAAVRSRIVGLGQQIAMFNDSVRNNLSLGAHFSDDQLYAVCRDAGIMDLVISLPNGLDSKLSFQGVNISGGQRQRVGIARALLRDADVFILDESTNALDEETKGLIVRNVLERYADRIVLFVTHDPFVVERVDEVIDLRTNDQPVAGAARG